MDQELHVIFGAGPVGRAVMTVLQAQGRPVRIVNRSGGDFPAGVENRRGDVMEASFARDAAQGATHVYFTLGLPYQHWESQFPPLQDNVIAAAAHVRARLIVMENLYVYGDTQGEPMREDTPMNPHTVKGQVRKAMHEALMAAHQAGQVKALAVRASNIFGPNTGAQSALGDRVIPAALKGQAASVLGDPSLRHTYTYVPDIGRAMVTLADDASALGSVWHLPSPKTMTTHDVLKLIYAQTGHRMRVQPAPKFILNMMSLFDPQVRGVLEMLYEFEQPFIMDHSKFARVYGDLSTPMSEAIQETVRWYWEREQN